MPDPRLPIIAGNAVDLFAARGDTGQMRGGLERRLIADPAHGRVGALAGRAAGSVSNGDKARRQRFEALDDLPETRLHFRRLRGEELEGDAGRGAVEIADRIGR